MDCIFCKIINGSIPHDPNHRIYEDEHTIAFLDINPIADGHTLVIPKRHADNLLEVSEEDAKHVVTTVRKIAIAMKKALKADGINILQANGKSAGQSVFHLHFHVVPRHEHDGLHIYPETKRLGHEGKEIAEQIKSNLPIYSADKILEENPMEKTFGTFKSQRSTEEILKESDKELWDE